MGIAISNYTKVIKLNPRDDEAYGNRGVAYDALGDEGKAMADFQQCLKINPHSIHIINFNNMEKRNK